MIPKIAHFYWSGPPMSWLRQQSIETFKAHNPDWEVRRHGYERGLDSIRDRVLDSDRTRYQVLAKDGGMYFDTDIIFTAPIPGEWLVKDNAIVGRDGVALGVAVLGSYPGSKFFRSLVRDCEERLQTKIVLAYQSLGIKLFSERDVRRMAALWNESVFQIPIERLFPCTWAGIEKLWSPIPWVIPADSVGVHWFGGDELSREYEPLISPDTLDDYPCLITQILKQQVAA